MSSGDRAAGHVRIDHEFRSALFDYNTPIKFQPCIKMQFFFRKLPDVSWEHFSAHYAHIHSDLTVAAKSFRVCGVQRYTQQHQSPEMKEAIRSMGMDVLDYDGCSTLWFRSWDDARGFFSAEDYAALAADCVHFMDTKGGIKVMAGQEVICFGKGVPDLDSSDGVTEHLEHLA